MSRSLKKGPFVEAKLYSRIDAMNSKNEKNVIKTWSRASTIFPEFVGHTIAVYDSRGCRYGSIHGLLFRRLLRHPDGGER